VKRWYFSTFKYSKKSELMLMRGATLLHLGNQCTTCNTDAL